MCLHHARTRRVRQLLILLCFLSFVDLCFTLWAARFTPFVELNPIPRALLLHSAVAELVVMKLTLTGIGATIFWRLRRFGRAEIGLWTVVLVYLVLTVRWSSYTREVAMLTPVIAPG